MLLLTLPARLTFLWQRFFDSQLLRKYVIGFSRQGARITFQDSYIHLPPTRVHSTASYAEGNSENALYPYCASSSISKAARDSGQRKRSYFSGDTFPCWMSIGREEMS